MPVSMQGIAVPEGSREEAGKEWKYLMDHKLFTCFAYSRESSYKDGLLSFIAYHTLSQYKITFFVIIIL